MFKTPQDLFKFTTDYVAALPKTFEEVKTLAEKTKKVYEAEEANFKSVVSTYNRAAKGDASVNEITAANKKAQSLLVTARFTALMCIPGAFFAMPLIAKAAEEYDVELIPESVHKEFGI